MICSTCGGDHPAGRSFPEAARLCIDSLAKLVASLNKRVAQLETQGVHLVLCEWPGVDDELFRNHGTPEGHCTHCAAAKFNAVLEKAEAALEVLGTGKFRKKP